MARRSKRQEEEQEAGAPAWMTTYSDMVTLLLAFFVLLFTFSSIDVRKFENALLSMQGALGILQSGQTLSPEPPFEAPGQFQNEEMQIVRIVDIEQIEELERLLRLALAEEGLEYAVIISIDERGLVVRFTDSVLFDTGRAELREEAMDILARVAEVLSDQPNHVRVEGHTDTVPITTLRFPSNWELSTARASMVVRHLIDRHEMDPERLSASGYGEHRPIADNESADGRQQNRRVDVLILYLSELVLEPR